MVAGSRATQCRKRGSKRIPSRRCVARASKNHEKRHAIVFFGAVSSRSGHRSVGYHRPCGRRRSETNAAAEAHGMSVYAWSAFAARMRIGRIDGIRLHEIWARRSGHFSMPATALHRSESYLSRPVAPFKAMGRALVAPLPPNFCCMPSERAVGPFQGPTRGIERCHGTER